MKRYLLALCLVALLGVAPAAAQLDFTRYVALGDSLTAGFASGSLHQFYQEASYPKMLADQANGFDFQTPLVSAPGIEPILVLQSLVPPELVPSSPVPGAPINPQLVRPYNNLGVVGANTNDFLNTVGDIQNLLAGNLDNVFHDLVLRCPTVIEPRNGQDELGLPCPSVEDPGSGQVVPFPAVKQAINLGPTFATLWIGNNDVLGAAVYGTPIEGITMTPVGVFEQLYNQALGALVNFTNADIVAFTLPDVTVIPFVTTLDPYIDVPGVGRVPLIGSNGPLPADAFVTLFAKPYLEQGVGIPVELGGTGLPLPEDLHVVGTEARPGVVLRQEEVAVISQRVADFNGIITNTAGSMGVPVFDVNHLFHQVMEGDRWVLGGIELTGDFLAGGIFSYDGIHPQNIGHGMIAVELIDFLNQTYGTTIPQVNMDLVLCAGGCADQGPPAAFNKDAVFTPEAKKQLLLAFPLLRRPGPQLATRGVHAHSH